jgi:hypothetical protein
MTYRNSYLLLLLLDHVKLLTDVDTIKKLTDIFVLDASRLGDLGARQRHLVDVNAGDLDLILNIIGSLVGDTLKKCDSADGLLAQKVADLDDIGVGGGVLGAGNIDGEMGITESHLVLEALGDTSDHVLDVRAHSAVGRKKPILKGEI